MLPWACAVWVRRRTVFYWKIPSISQYCIATWRLLMHERRWIRKYNCLIRYEHFSVYVYDFWAYSIDFKWFSDCSIRYFSFSWILVLMKYFRAHRIKMAQKTGRIVWKKDIWFLCSLRLNGNWPIIIEKYPFSSGPNRYRSKINIFVHSDWSTFVEKFSNADKLRTFVRIITMKRVDFIFAVIQPVCVYPKMVSIGYLAIMALMLNANQFFPVRFNSHSNLIHDYVPFLSLHPFPFCFSLFFLSLYFYVSPSC